jgi:hypothetical protein
METTMTKEKWAAEGDFYYSQADQATGQRRLDLLQKSRDCYLQGGATKEARIVERALDRNRLLA